MMANAISFSRLCYHCTGGHEMKVFVYKQIDMCTGSYNQTHLTDKRIQKKPFKMLWCVLLQLRVFFLKSSKWAFPNWWRAAEWQACYCLPLLVIGVKFMFMVITENASKLSLSTYFHLQTFCWWLDCVVISQFSIENLSNMKRHCHTFIGNILKSLLR